MTKSFQLPIEAPGRRLTERRLVKKTYIDYVFAHGAFVLKMYVPNTSNKFFTNLSEREILHNWFINYYLIQTLFIVCSCALPIM